MTISARHSHERASGTTFFPTGTYGSLSFLLRDSRDFRHIFYYPAPHLWRRRDSFLSQRHQLFSRAVSDFGFRLVYVRTAACAYDFLSYQATRTFSLRRQLPGDTFYGPITCRNAPPAHRRFSHDFFLCAHVNGDLFRRLPANVFPSGAGVSGILPTVATQRPFPPSASTTPFSSHDHAQPDSADVELFLNDARSQPLGTRVVLRLNSAATFCGTSR